MNSGYIHTLLVVRINGFLGQITAINCVAMRGEVDGVPAFATPKLDDGTTSVTLTGSHDADLGWVGDVEPIVEIIPVILLGCNILLGGPARGAADGRRV